MLKALREPVGRLLCLIGPGFCDSLSTTEGVWIKEGRCSTDIERGCVCYVALDVGTLLCMFAGAAHKVGEGGIIKPVLGITVAMWSSQ